MPPAQQLLQGPDRHPLVIGGVTVEADAKHGVRQSWRNANLEIYTLDICETIVEVIHYHCVTLESQPLLHNREIGMHDSNDVGARLE